MNRRTFVRITGGVLATLNLQRGESRSGVVGWRDPAMLESGLIGMARAKGWFEAHWGAALIAGHYLCLDPMLDEATVTAIRAELDALVEGRGASLRPFAADKARTQSIDDLARSLLPALDGGLRVHGHAVIYAALALRALKDAPHMAIPAITERIQGWIEHIGKMKPQSPRGRPIATEGDRLAATTFSRLREFAPLVGHPLVPRPNFTHWTTHTEALTRLAALGHGDMARLGHLGLQAHLEFDVPAVPAVDAVDRSQVTLTAMLAPDFWRADARRNQWRQPWHIVSNRNGDWIASGHLFKVLYAFTNLARTITDRALVEQAAVVLFERYFDPAVGGG
jgi:hypothetical protein